jgi:autotransporter-associated beta strand protein
MHDRTILATLLLATTAFLSFPDANFAQTTVDFETPVLDPESYNQGADGQGGFLCQGTFFSHYYDQNYFSWDNWALSNKTDTTTPGFMNQYSAITGGGINGSPQYAVAYGVYANNNQVSLNFAEPRSLQGGYFTNTTYAYLAMANGYYGATKFSRLHDDYFKLTFTGVDLLGNATGSKDLYLADFRDPALRTDDPRTDDYILNDWNWVNLAGLGSNVKSLQISFASSDVGEWGINTPTYFAADNLTFDGPIANNPVWTGAGSGSELGNAANWNGTPAQSGDILQFAGVLKSAAVNDLTGVVFAGIDWHYGAAAMTLSGNAFILSGDVHNYATNPQTLDVTITLTGGNHSFDAALGDIEAKQMLYESESPVGITKLGGHKLILSGQNNYSGDTDIQAGTLVLTTGGDINAASKINVSAGATLEIESGDHTLGIIDGQGTTLVDSGATLSATSIRQDTLIIGSHASAVPEPGTFAMLLAAAVGLCFAAKKLCGGK